MVLTNTRPAPRDPSKFPAAQLFLLSLVRLAEPIAITSLLPWAWKLVLHFDIGQKSDASFYAGLLVAAFSLTEACSGMFWGALSDRCGRKPVLLGGLVGTAISLLVVGFSTNFWMALFGRCLGGALTGNNGVVQTMVGELLINPKHEPKGYAVMPFAWSVGTILGPIIGGLAAEPAVNYPQLFPRGGLFDTFPYLLPNLICACVMGASIGAGYVFLEETHPGLQPGSGPYHCDEDEAEASFMHAQGDPTSAPFDLTQDSYGTFHSVNEEAIGEEWTVKPSGASRPPSGNPEADQTIFSTRIITLTIALAIFTYHSMTYDHLMPVFFEDERVPANGRLMNGLTRATATRTGSLAGGLGRSVRETGVIMSVNGVIALVVQGIVFPLMVSWLGVWRTFMVTAIGHPIAYFIVPYLALLPEHLLYPGIYACLAVRNFFSILAYPVLLILIKEATPFPRALGRINGLAASTGAASRTIGSPIAGYLYGLGIKMDLTAIAWWSSALVALVGTIQAFFINRVRGGPRYHVQSVFEPDHHQSHRPSVVHIRVEDGIDSGYSSADERTPLFATRVPDR